ncbi:POC1 centriolar protein A [Fasciola gigantica]|uniref:POC1 centriolar protein A n=1 Tax=Fasciola gigantica TaxID=46835 RepID=A0A504YLV9_FASGI|nr:POC1 centriolar protein A [Fasciola gigantica]
MFDLLEGRPLYTLQGHAGPVTAAVFSASGDHFASGGSDEQVFLWKTNFDTYLNDATSKDTTCRVNGHRACEEGTRRSGSSRPPKKPSVVVEPYAQIERANGALDCTIQSSNRGDQLILQEDPNKAATASIQCHHQPHRTTGASAPSYLPLPSTVNITETATNLSEQMSNDRQNIPPPLNTTLEHILSQLDILTQTVSILEQRLTLVENRAKTTT